MKKLIVSMMIAQALSLSFVGGFADTPQDLAFEPNRGQTAPDALYLTRGNHYTLFLTKTEAVFRFEADREEHSTLRMRLLGSNPNPCVMGAQPLPGKVNYFQGANREEWHNDIPTFKQVKYQRVYPGIDLLYYSREGQLEYDFIVEPGADPRKIALKFSTPFKKQPVILDKQGNLQTRAAGGDVTFQKPIAYQWVNGKRRAVPARFTLTKGNRVGFKVGAFDRRLPLIIDPILVYSTYMGGSSNEDYVSIAVDAQGNRIIAGTTASANFPISPDAFQTTRNAGLDVFVAKFAPDGTRIFGTYYGGSGDDYAFCATVDPNGNTYLCGSTTSFFDLPVANSAQPFRGFQDAFVAKLSADGRNLIYATPLGGSTSTDTAVGIAVDSAGQAYITGYVSSTDFPVSLNAYQSARNGTAYDAFITKLSSQGNAILYSTYFGGSANELVFGIRGLGGAIALDSDGSIYITGSTQSNNFPLSNASQALYGGGHDAYVVKFDSNWNLVYSTYLGGSGNDYGTGIAVDEMGNAYICGTTASGNFPILNAYQSALRVQDAFLTKLLPDGSNWAFSTYFGGGSTEIAHDIALDELGNIYLAGYTTSNNLPTRNPLQASISGGNDAFIAKFNPTASALLFGSYLGGSDADNDLQSSGLAVDRSGNIYLSGSTNSANFPTTPGAFQSAKSGAGRDAFLTVIFAPNGDVNNDGCVNDEDMLAIIFAFGNTGANQSADLNGDGIVDDIDFLMALFNFGAGC